MKAFVASKLSKETKLVYSTLDVGIYYKWNPKITWIEMEFKHKNLVLNFYVVPTKDYSCVYMAYIPCLDGVGLFLDDNNFDWEDLFKVLPTLGNMFRNVQNKDNASSYISFFNIPRKEYKKVGMVCMKIKNHPYPYHDICLLENDFLGDAMSEEVGRRLQALLNDIELFYNEFSDTYQKGPEFNWGKFWRKVGKVALVVAALLYGSDADPTEIDEKDFIGGDFEGNSEDMGNTMCTNISDSDNVGDNDISFKGTPWSKEELQEKICKAEEDVDYYSRQLENELEKNNPSNFWINELKNKIESAQKEIENRKRDLKYL